MEEDEGITAVDDVDVDGIDEDILGKATSAVNDDDDKDARTQIE